MSFLAEWPVWAVMVAIFLLRITDVSIGTVRTLALVEGRAKIAVVMGFFEVSIWITAVSQVITRLHDSLFIVLAYAAGFAVGNAVGLMIERRMAFGTNVVRLFSSAGQAIAAALRTEGRVVTTFAGAGREGPVTMVYVSCPRRETGRVLDLARAIDADIFYNIERAQAAPRHEHGVIHEENAPGFSLLTGTLRSVLKKK